MSEHSQSKLPNPWRTHRHVMRSLGSPLTETRGGGETVSVRKRGMPASSGSSEPSTEPTALEPSIPTIA